MSRRPEVEPADHFRAQRRFAEPAFYGFMSITSFAQLFLLLFFDVRGPMLDCLWYVAGSFLA